jgi:hypothetical protein
MTKFATIVRDAAGCFGCALVAVGAGMIYLPAGLIVAGALLVGGAWQHARMAGG